jgi:hypothetical protein
MHVDGDVSKFFCEARPSSARCCGRFGDSVDLARRSTTTRLAPALRHPAGYASRRPSSSQARRGRTLFDLQTTTECIASRTKHLKGVKIAIMGYNEG